MSSNDKTNTSTDAESASTLDYMGRVKWFNNRAGYGFVTVLTGDKRGTDIFAHHSGVKVNQEQYRYLVQGEYVSFNTSRSDSKDHKWQAVDVRGIMGGKLMCETHWDMRKEREDRARHSGNEHGYTGRREHRDHKQRPRRYGGGPREDSEGFTLSKSGHRQNTEDVSVSVEPAE